MVTVKKPVAPTSVKVPPKATIQPVKPVAPKVTTPVAPKVTTPVAPIATATTAPKAAQATSTAPHAAAVPNIQGNQQIPYNMPSEPAPKATAPAKPATPAKPAPKATTPAKPATTAKTATQLDYETDSPARLQEIQGKLTGYAGTRPELFTDRNAFNNFFKYGERSPAQKKVLDDFYKNQEGVNAAKQMQTDASRLNTLNTKFGTALATISDADATFLMNSNPEKYKEYLAAKAQASALDIVNGTNTITDSTFPDTTPDSAFEQLMKDWGVVLTPQATTDMSEAYHQAVTTNVQPYITAVEEARTKVEAFKKSYDNTLADVRKEYAGTGVTEAFIRAMAAKKADEQLSEYQQAQNDYNDALTAYNTQIGLVDKEYELEYKDQTLAIQATQAQVENFATMYGIYKETPAGMAETAAATYAANYPSMDTGTTMQKQQALNQALKPYYDTYGAIINRPQAQVVSDILAYAKSKGMSVSKAFKENFLTPLQAKPYYKALLAKELDIAKESAINQDIKKVGDYYFKQDANGDWQPYYPGTTSNISGVTPSGTFSSVKLQTGTIKLDTVAASAFQTAYNEMKQAGQVVSGVNGLRTQEQQDELYGYGRTAAQCTAAGVDVKYAKPNEAQRTWTTNSTHLVGLAVDVYGNKGAKPSEKQIEIMNKNGWFQPSETMAKGDYGHFEYAGTGQTNAGYDKTLWPVYSKYLTSKAFTEAERKQLESAGLNIKNIASQAALWKNAESPESNKAREVYTVANELKKQIEQGLEYIDAGTGLGTGTYKTRNYTGTGPKLMQDLLGGYANDEDRNLFISRFDRLMALLTTDQLSALRGLGAMSDKEFTVMQSASTSLNIGIDEVDFTKILDNMISAKVNSPYYSKWNLEETVVLP